ncbi:MAG TPA: aspartyl protease family protein, partial [Candidatus Tumulicola sp.]|nr:aspartyl protease family protein [Candidatus Tumulicola sp.]
HRLCVAVFFLLLPLSVLPARAAETLSPATISITDLFRRVRKAEGQPTQSAYHIVMRSVVEGETTVEDTYVDPRGYKTVETAAGFTSSWGALGGQGWYQNSNGFVQRVSGVYAQNDPIEHAVREIGSSAGSAQLLGMTAGSPAMYVVELSPKPGLSEKRYYDADTYLLRRIELTDYDGRTRISEYDDYRSVLGRMVPFVRTYQADFSKESRRYDVITYEAVRPGVADLSIPASKTLFDLRGRDSVTIPADFTDDGIIVRMNVGQRGLDMLLDSGSSSTVVNAAVASQLGLAVHNKRLESFGGIFSLSDARVDDISVGPLQAASAAINIAPVDDDVAPTQRIVGLLGCDFIASGALEVDFTHKSLTLYAHPPADLVASGWTELPITLDDCVPLTKAAFSGLAGEFLIDLGAYDTVLYDHYFAQFKGSSTPKGGDPLINEGSFIGGDEVRFQTYSMRTLSIGNLLFADAVVDVPLTKKVQERDYDGLLGRTTLTSFDILFDYAHQRVYLKPRI